MKKILVCFFLLLLTLSGKAVSVSVTFNLDAGVLTDNSGNVLTDGSLLLLLASPTGVGFSADVNEGSYVGGDTIIVTDFAMSTLPFPYAAGEAVAVLDGLSIPSGYKLALRWFPSVTDAQYKALFSPTAGLYYGTYAGATTGNPDGGDPWVASSDGSFTLNLWTTAIGGSQPVSAGKASSQVKAVPEPTSMLLLATGGAFLAGAMLRRRKAA